MAKSKVTINETHEIPSRGNIYGSMNIPSKFTIRAMSTIDEKFRLSSSDGIKVMPALIKRCIIDPDSVDVNRLKLFDLQFLMYKLRIVTYGTEYKVELQCPHCGHKFEVEINLDDIPVNYVPEEFNPIMEIGPLPVNGDTLGCKFVDSNDIEDISRESARILRKYPDYEGNPEVIVKWRSILCTKNGEDFKVHEIQKYIEELHAKDLRYLESKYDKLSDQFGLDLSMTEICPNPRCGEDVDFELPITSEFFRPEY